MQRIILGRATLVVVVVVAIVALTGESSFSETIPCRTSPGAPAPKGMHWYYRVDRTNNRHCWFTQAAGLPVHSQPTGMGSNPNSLVAREGISVPLQTDPTELSQFETPATDSAETGSRDTDSTTGGNSTDTRTPSVDDPTANFANRWSDSPKAADVDQQESTPRDYASEPMASDSTKPTSTGFFAADSKEELPHKSARTIHFWPIFFAAILSMLLFGGLLKLIRWLYRSATRWWTRNDSAETNSSELVRTLRRIDEAFSSSVTGIDVLTDQASLIRDSVRRRPHAAPRRFETSLVEVGQQLPHGRSDQPVFGVPRGFNNRRRLKN